MSNIPTCRSSKINGRQSISGDYDESDVYLLVNVLTNIYVNADMCSIIN